jgi:hypothetical protein
MKSSLIYKDEFGQEWTLSKEDKSFNDAADSYIEKFGGSIPRGIGMPEITTELLLEAVKNEIEIQPFPIPEGAES